ncbi:MAG: DUF1156 domain-containing protein, partial [Anaerolineae bacterium]|nr:DUF1156 domain-containing protein [Anaerolineae bacterium]
MTYRKKLIEVALPLEAISDASAYEKMPGIGPHPRGIHLWWARRPLATTRAVIFASLVDDPDDPDASEPFVEECRALPPKLHAAIADTARHRLLDFVADLADWRNIRDVSRSQSLLETADRLINLSLERDPPTLIDPFAGGGAIPLEAQRLGLEAHASDLNPVAVMINKALIEIPPRFADMPPVNPHDRKGTGQGGSWKGAAGLAADVRHYGEWIRDRAWERIGHLYPDCNGEKVIAWLWARTVRCPNPACGVQMPLVRSFSLSNKKGRRAWVEPHVDRLTRKISFQVKTGQGKVPRGTVKRQGARCLACDTPVSFDHVREEARSGRMGASLMAIVTDGHSGRSYRTPTPQHELVSQAEIPTGVADTDLPEQALGFRVQLYGMTKHRDLFTPRQLVALSTLSELVTEARQRIYADANAASLPADDTTLRDGGHGARAYAEAVTVYLAFSIDRLADFNNSLTRWVPSNEKIMNLFARHAVPMVWDFGEANILYETVGGWMTCVEYCSACIELLRHASRQGKSTQMDAAQMSESGKFLISTDPPYYDNIGYADLS